MINLGMATAAEARRHQVRYALPRVRRHEPGLHRLSPAERHRQRARLPAAWHKDVATVVTQVLVDEADPAFQHPTKPVGAFYDKETADRIAAEKGYTMVEDAGRGYRQVVPSPKPIDVIEKNTVKALVDAGTVVITVGGGGIPVVAQGRQALRHARRHRQGLCLRQARRAARRRYARHPDGGREGRHQLRQARPEVVWTTLTPDEARKYIEERPVRARLHAAQGAGRSVLRRVQARPRRPHHPAARRPPDGISGKTGTRVHQ